MRKSFAATDTLRISVIIILYKNNNIKQLIVGKRFMKKAETVINEAEEFLKKGNNRKVISIFLEKYSKCEVVCRYCIRNFSSVVGDDEEVIDMDLKTIKSALSEMGYKFEDEKLLTKIWGKNSKRNQSSCRFLRNKISHELMKRALNEVVERKDELFSYMDEFIENIINKKEKKYGLN